MLSVCERDSASVARRGSSATCFTELEKQTKDFRGGILSNICTVCEWVSVCVCEYMCETERQKLSL